jgi:hypothetical protein
MQTKTGAEAAEYWLWALGLGLGLGSVASVRPPVAVVWLCDEPVDELDAILTAGNVARRLLMMNGRRDWQAPPRWKACETSPRTVGAVLGGGRAL